MLPQISLSRQADEVGDQSRREFTPEDFALPPPPLIGNAPGHVSDLSSNLATLSIHNPPPRKHSTLAPGSFNVADFVLPPLPLQRAVTLPPPIRRGFTPADFVLPSLPSRQLSYSQQHMNLSDFSLPPLPKISRPLRSLPRAHTAPPLASMPPASIPPGSQPSASKPPGSHPSVSQPPASKPPAPQSMPARLVSVHAIIEELSNTINDLPGMLIPLHYTHNFHIFGFL